MKISAITIQNFRSIEKLSFKPRRLTTLIGPNNAAKSSVLRALEIFLNQQAPELDEWRSGHANEPIIFEVEFSEVKDWERNQPGVSAHVFDGKIRIRATYTRGDEAKSKVQTAWESYRQKETIDGWPDGAKFSELAENLRTLANNNGIEVKRQFSKANQEKLRDLVRVKLPENLKLGDTEWNSEAFSIPAALQQALPQARIIPAVRIAELDGEPGAKTSFGLLLKEIILPAVAQTDEFKALLDAVSVLEKMAWSNWKRFAYWPTTSRNASRRLLQLKSRLAWIRQTRKSSSATTPRSDWMMGQRRASECRGTVFSGH